MITHRPNSIRSSIARRNQGTEVRRLFALFERWIREVVRVLAHGDWHEGAIGITLTLPEMTSCRISPSAIKLGQAQLNDPNELRRPGGAFIMSTIFARRPSSMGLAARRLSVIRSKRMNEPIHCGLSHIENHIGPVFGPDSQRAHLP
jgi:hypothetical protein